jgi:Tol biopolymer transport system component
MRKVIVPVLIIVGFIFVWILTAIPGTQADAPAAVNNALDVSGSGHHLVNGASSHASISADGRYIAFSSSADGALDLAAPDALTRLDVFVHDRQTATTVLISQGMDDQAANGSSWEPKISANGLYVTFSSNAGNLVTGDTNNLTDVFICHWQTGTMERVSIRTGGAEGNAPSYHPSISGDGRYIVFASEASTLVASDSNGVKDIFLRDRLAGGGRGQPHGSASLRAACRPII